VKVWLERTFTGARAADAESAEILKRIPIGTTFEGDIVTQKKRSNAWHRRYWALMSMLAENVEQVEIEPGVTLPIRDAEGAHVAMKYLTGLYDSYAIKGGVVRLLKSTAFEKMSPEQWAAYWRKVLDAVHERLLPGVELPAVEEEIARLAS